MATRKATKRPLFLAIAVVVAFVAAALPIAISMRVAEEEVARREQEGLELYANAAVARMEMVMAEVIEALHEMKGLSDAPCSDGNLASMRRIAFTYRHLSDAGRYAGTYRLCSALLGDVFRRHMTLPGPDWRDSQGFEYWFDLDNPFGAPRSTMLVGRHGHYASIDPRSFVDVVELDDQHLGAISTATGTVIAATADSEVAQMAREYRRSIGGADNSDDPHTFVRASARTPFAAVVQAPPTGLPATWPMLVGSLVVAGLVVGLLLAALVFRAMSRRLTMEGALRNAVRRRGLEVHYQPIVALEDGRCVGVEALLR